MTDQLGAMLVVERGMPDTSVIPLDRPACLLRKSPSADIVVDNPYVSRRHAQIALRGDSFEIVVSGQGYIEVRKEVTVSDGVDLIDVDF